MFGQTALLKELNKNNILSELNKKGYNEIDLCHYYILGFKGLNIPIKSDLRNDDKNASLHISTNTSGNIIISDFGLITGLNIFSYISYKYFNDTTYKGILKALELIRVDFNLSNIQGYLRMNIKKSNKVPKKLNVILKKREEVEISVKRRKWEFSDIEYWKQFGISIKKLEEKKISPIEKCRIINPNTITDTIIYFKNTPAYVYPEFYDKVYYKIYLPYGLNGNSDFKWISNIPKTIISNLKYIPQSGKLLIIQSSYKDTMCMEELGNYHVLPLNGEGIWYPDAAWQYLKLHWDKIIYFGNNDFNKDNNPGITFCKKYQEKYNIEYITTPDNTTSDISDYYKKYGENETKKLLNNLLNKFI